MKKLLIPFLLFAAFICHAQKELTFKDGSTVQTERFREQKGFVYYLDNNDEIIKVKSGDVKIVRDLTLSETEFEYNQKGLTPYIVVDVDSMSQQQLFEQTINWIKETYKNPDEVIKATIDNDKVRFKAVEVDGMRLNSPMINQYYDATYTITISFKNGKYKFEPVSMTYEISSDRLDEPINFSDGTDLYKKDGRIRTVNETIPASITSILNDLNDSLYKYLKDFKNADSNKDDW